MKKLILILALVAAAPLSVQAAFKSVAAGVNYPTAQGTRYSSMQRKLGFEANTIAHTDLFGWLDKFDMKFTAFYQPYSLYGSTAMLNMAAALAGLESKGTAHNFIVEPHFGLQVGGMYDWLTFQDESSTSHSQFHMLARANMGVSAPVWNKLTIVLESPITMIMRAQDPILVWNANLLARWRFE